jgi:4-amino-4-deoxy-L-arabinose transferase-like glycosyltransferase
MDVAALLERIGHDWRGRALAALVALAAGLPGLIALPPLDRDESRFAEASAQMLETGDFVSPKFQDTPRFKKPVGIYWLQAASVATLSHVEDRRIWAYRVPSILGAMLAAAACVWGAAAFLGPGASLLAGAMFGASFLLSAEASIAATDGVLAGGVTLAMAALGRLYLAARGGPPAGRRVKVLFWTGMAISILVKGPIGPMVAALALVALCLWERRARWLADLGWGWGLLAILALVGPWALAITVASDGAFWGASLGGDLAPKLLGGQEGHGEPPGFYAVLAPLLLFPATVVLPAGVVAGWKARAEPAVRFALCWLIPAWIVFEIAPTKLAHYPLPLFGAAFWLIARALEPFPLGVEQAERTRKARTRYLDALPDRQSDSTLAGSALVGPPGRIVRWTGVALTIVVAAAFAAAGPLVAARVNGGEGMGWAVVTALLYIAAGAVGAGFMIRSQAVKAVVAGGALALLAHGLLLGVTAPSLRALWLSSRAARALAAAGASPRQGVIPGPVTVAGYEEPSLVFLLGTGTELGDASAAADAIAEGRPAIVEARQTPAFAAALVADGVKARRAGEGAGLDYSNNQHDVLQIFLPAGAPTSENKP